jgi:predicted ATP-grasp superfamily ATP-dependent carboligase
MPYRLLLLDGNQRAALAATRSLGSKGIEVIVAESANQSLAGQSRYCFASDNYRNPFTAPRKCFEDILGLIEKHSIQFILPITEATVYTLLRYRDEIPENVHIPFPSADQVEQLADKNALFHLAQQIGVPCPTSIFCNNRQEGLSSLAEVHEYPVILKPSKSRRLLADEILSTNVVVAYSREEAEQLLRASEQFKYPFTIQSFIEGHGQGVFALYNQGQPVCFFAHRRIREKPPEGGVSVLSESAPVDEGLKGLAHQLLSNAQWHGVAMVEFRVTPDGSPYLMEINPRFWGSLQLAVDAGIDFPYWLFCITMNLPLPDDIRSRPARLRWLLGDLDRLYLVLKRPLARYSIQAKLLEILRFMIPRRGTRHEVNRMDDFRPFLFELQEYVRALLKG